MFAVYVCVWGSMCVCVWLLIMVCVLPGQLVVTVSEYTLHIPYGHAYKSCGWWLMPIFKLKLFVWCAFSAFLGISQLLVPTWPYLDRPIAKFSWKKHTSFALFSGGISCVNMLEWKRERTQNNCPPSHKGGRGSIIFYPLCVFILIIPIFFS